MVTRATAYENLAAKLLRFIKKIDKLIKVNYTMKKRRKKMKRYKRKGKPSKAPPKAEFEFMYYDLDLSADELAERYNVKKQTIYNWAMMYRKDEE